MKVLAAGGVGADADHVRRTLDRHHKKTPVTLLVTTLDFAAAWQWATDNGVPFEVFEPSPEHGAAGVPVMNQAILREHRPAVCVAFPGDRGTGDLVNRAMMARVPVYVPQADRSGRAASRAPRSAG